MLAPFYHVGIVVPDVPQAQAEVGGALGLTWGTPMTIPIPVQYEGEVTLREFTFVYSVDGPPFVELVAAGSPPWTISDGVHHIGYWSDGLSGDIEHLRGKGYTLVAHGVNEDGALFGFAYLRDRYGLLVELVDVAVQAMLIGGTA
jgi:catechol 2,3-dioxygenase-like lactoylglutathione lyase family enzyme